MKINRRNFLSTAALAAPAAFARAGHAAETAAGKPLKVCVFADIHYRPGTFPNSEDRSFLELILARAERENCDMMIHLGDFVHNVRQENEKAYIKLYNETRYYFEDGDYGCDFADCALRMERVLSLMPVQCVHKYKILLEAAYAIDKRIRYNYIDVLLPSFIIIILGYFNFNYSSSCGNSSDGTSSLNQGDITTT